MAAQANACSTDRVGTAGLNNFNLQVYRLGTYDGITRDPTLFPDFKPNTPAAMKQEVLQFLGWMFAQGRGVKDFYTTPGRLRELPARPALRCGRNVLERPGDAHEESISIPSQRSGLLTQAGFLSSYIEGSGDPDIIHRGVFIATRLLCKMLPPPDPRAMGTMIMESPTRDQPGARRADDRAKAPAARPATTACSTPWDTHSRTTTPSASTGRSTAASR